VAFRVDAASVLVSLWGRCTQAFVSPACLVVLATVPGDPASVRVKNRKATEPAKSWRVVTRTGHIPAGFWPGWNRSKVPFSRFQPLWL